MSITKFDAKEIGINSALCLTLWNDFVWLKNDFVPTYVVYFDRWKYAISLFFAQKSWKKEEKAKIVRQNLTIKWDFVNLHQTQDKGFHPRKKTNLIPFCTFLYLLTCFYLCSGKHFLLCLLKHYSKIRRLPGLRSRLRDLSFPFLRFEQDGLKIPSGSIARCSSFVLPFRIQLFRT